MGVVTYRFKGTKPPVNTVEDLNDPPGGIQLADNLRRGPYPWYASLGLAGTVWVSGVVDANSTVWSQVDGSCIGYR